MTRARARTASALRDQWKSALIYSHDDGDSWNRLLEFNGRCVNFSIANGHQGVNPSLVVSVNNLKSGENKAIIISMI
jgi:hypothetical protein